MQQERLFINYVKQPRAIEVSGIAQLTIYWFNSSAIYIPSGCLLTFALIELFFCARVGLANHAMNVFLLLTRTNRLVKTLPASSAGLRKKLKASREEKSYVLE